MTTIAARHATEHNHGARWVPTGEVDELGDPIRVQVSGAAACPVCSAHDHSDTTPFGFTVLSVRGEKPNPTSGDHLVRTFRIPVPAWAFTCRACCPDSCEAPALMCDTWTPAGARWRRDHPELFPGQLPLAMDSDDLVATEF